jgi:hypothetical protein
MVDTVAVLTKVDIMVGLLTDIVEKGTDAAEALAGRIVPLKLGFIGVINRYVTHTHTHTHSSWGSSASLIGT